ncbi:YdeI/OmpD-associated family protein [Marinoscillum sp.]|uniref:YdeI/OmpD-associated family protein n=1 Tax=Marinoscillum sp. TaxID=2024838 RepID=UPI003BA89D33
MQFTTHLSKFTEVNASVYGLHLPVPLAIAEQFIDGDQKRVKCTINNSKTISSGLMPFRDYWYILINQTLKKELGLEIGDEVHVSLEKDTSQYGMDMPEELRTCLDQDPLADTYFHKLTPGKQRNLIYIVSKVKSVDSRINKALAIIEHLTEQSGKLNFKLLNEKIKEYNQRGKLR